MSKIFQVLSNLKLDGLLYETDSFIEGELKSFKELIDGGVLKVVKGAKDIESAKKIVEKENDDDELVDEEEESVNPENTWGPQPDDADAQETQDENKDTKEPSEVGSGDNTPVDGNKDKTTGDQL